MPCLWRPWDPHPGASRQAQATVAPQGSLLLRASTRSLLTKDWGVCWFAFGQEPICAASTLLLFRTEAHLHAYLDLGTSQYRSAERRALVKLAIVIGPTHRVSIITTKAYQGTKLMRFTLEEVRDYGKSGEVLAWVLFMMRRRDFPSNHFPPYSAAIRIHHSCEVCQRCIQSTRCSAYPPHGAWSKCAGSWQQQQQQQQLGACRGDDYSRSGGKDPGDTRPAKDAGIGT